MNKWSKPELVVLVRSKPEEAVLAGCKVAGVMGGPAGTFAGCLLLNRPGNCSTKACMENLTS